jgi:hypothetical protein
MPVTKKFSCQILWEGVTATFFTGRRYREVLLGCSYRDADKHSNYSTIVTYMKSIRRSYTTCLQTSIYWENLQMLLLLGNFTYA